MTTVVDLFAGLGGWSTGATMNLFAALNTHVLRMQTHLKWAREKPIAS